MRRGRHPPMKKPPRKVDWTRLADAITEAEVKLTWTADIRTRRSIVRQAKVVGFVTPTGYLLQLIAASLAGNEADTYIGPDGQLVNGCDINRP
jgi:hypothetical protein